MRWFEVEVGYADGPRMVDLAMRLKNPLAEAYPMRLWAYCYDQEVCRFSGPAAVATVERAARWRGKAGALVAVLLETGHLDRDGDALVVHGVGKRLDAARKRQADSAERQRRHRERKDGGHSDSNA